MSFKAPEETSNKDLRSLVPVLSITKMGENSFALKKTSSGQFFLVSKVREKQNMYKLSSGKARIIDEAFVDYFIKVKYMMPVFSGKKCSTLFDLEMRGEKSTICKSELEKENQSKKILSLFKEII